MPYEDIQKTGFIKEISSGGRILVPIGLRARYGMEIGTNVELLACDEGIIIVPYDMPRRDGSEDLRELEIYRKCLSTEEAQRYAEKKALYT